MSQEGVWISLRSTDEWNKIQEKLKSVEQEINSITVQLCDECDECDENKSRTLKRKRRALVEEKRFLVRARRAEPVLLGMSPRMSDMRERMIERARQAYAPDTTKDRS